MDIQRKDGSTLSLRSSEEGIMLREGKQHRTLLGADTLSLSIESVKPIDWQIGDSFSAFGELYKLNKLPNMTKTASNSYAYMLEMEAVQYDLMRVHFDPNITAREGYTKLRGRASTGDLRHFARLIVKNAERVFPRAWRLGEVVDGTEAKTLSFDDEGGNCLAVLQRLCKDFACEWRIDEDEDGTKTLHFVAEGDGEQYPDAFAVGYDRGLYHLERRSLESGNIITRLRAYGASQNLGNGYRSDRLCLPYRDDAESYIDETDGIERYGVWEAVKVFADIYPSRTGVVSRLVEGKPNEFIDTEMYDLMERNDAGETKYIVAGATPKVSFVSGALAGYDFDVAHYDHATHSFRLKGRKLEGLTETIPNAQLKPKAGDRYKLIDVGLPPKWAKEAEEALERKATDYLLQNAQPRASYHLQVSEAYLVRRYGRGAVARPFELGQYLRVQDREVGIDKHVRLVAYSRDLLQPYRYDITLADKVQVNYIQRIIEEQIQQTEHIQEVQAKSHSYTDRRFAEVERTTESLTALFGDRFGGVINPTAVKTMQLVAADESLQFTFVKTPSDRTPTNLNLHYDRERKRVIIDEPNGRLKHFLMHYTIPHKLLGSAVDTSRLRLWHLKDYTSDALREADKPYYLYALCLKAETHRHIDNTFAVSTSKLQDTDDKYAFLVGMLSSEDPEGNRSFVSLHGFSEILPGRITTDRIVSTDSNTYFDLKEGHINGNIVFTNSNNEIIMGRKNNKNQTNIKGGLVLSKSIGAVDQEGKLRSEMNGEMGKPAFRAGISDDGTQANVEIYHNGNAKFGQAYIDNDKGEFSFEELNAQGHLDRYLHIGGKMPNLQELIDGQSGQTTSFIGRSLDINVGGTEPLHGYREMYIQVRQEDSLISLSGELSISSSPGIDEESYYDGLAEGHWRSDYHYYHADVEANVYISTADGSRNVYETAISLPATSFGAGQGESRTIDLGRERVAMLAQGGYNLYVELRITGVYRDGTAISLSEAENLESRIKPTASISFSSNAKAVVSYNRGNKASITLCKGGLNVFYRADRYLHLQKEGTPFLTIKGNTDIFGVLACGEIAGNGEVVWQSGAKAASVANVYLEGGNPQRKRYKIYHNIGHTNYSASITTIRSRDYATIFEKTATYLTIGFLYAGGFKEVDLNETHGQGNGFVYTLFGNN